MCKLCSHPFTKSEERRPQTFCSSGHKYCHNCCSRLSKCPVCGSKPTLSVSTDENLASKLKHNWQLIEKNIPKIVFDDIQGLNSSPIAHGTYADVFACSWHDTKVAIKKLRVKPIDDHFDQLQCEARIGMALNHPNIVCLFGLTTFPNGYLGIVMELADKGTLRDGMKNMEFSPKVSISICICTGLEYLHLNHIAHRDLKPENILLFGDVPIAKISDFGTSKAIQTFATYTGGIKGTLQYSAPELLGKKLRYGVAVDVYSFNTILFEMFTGKCPFPGDLFEVLEAKRRNENPTVPNNFPELLNDLVRQGWIEDPTQRPELKDYHSALSQMKGLVSIFH